MESTTFFAVRFKRVAGTFLNMGVALLILMHWGPGLKALLFGTGTRILVYNLARLLILPFIAIFFVGAGRLFERVTKADFAGAAALTSFEATLLQFFEGAALVSVLGCVLGLTGLLDPPLLWAIFAAVTFYFHRTEPRFWRRAANKSILWLSGDDLPILISRFVGCAFALYTYLSHALIFELTLDDSLQLYDSYLSEVALRHGSIPNFTNPRFADFIIAKGNGIYLFLCSAADAHLNSGIGYLFLLGAIAVGACFLKRMLRNADQLWPVIFGIASLWWLGPKSEFAKYHLQTAAFTLCILFVSSLAVGKLRTFRNGLGIYAIALALGLSLPHSAFFCALIALIGVLAFRAPREIRFFSGLFGGAAIGAALSMGINWLVIGIPEISPFRMFSALRIPSLFDRWTSIDILRYTSATQEPLTNPSFLQSLYGLFYHYPIATTGRAFMFAAFGFALATRVLGRRVAPVLCVFIAGGVSIGVSLFHLQLKPVFPILLLVLPWLSLLKKRSKTDWTTGTSLMFSGYVILFVASAAALNSPSLTRMLTHLNIPLLILFFFEISQLQVSRELTTLIVLSPLLDFVFSSPRWSAHFEESGLTASFFSALLVLATLLQFNQPIKRLKAAATGFVLAVFTAVVLSLAHGELEIEKGNKLRFFAGRSPMIEVNPIRKPDFERCIELANAVPPDEKIVHLNAYSEMGFCVFSPLLQGRELLHQYESLIGQHFRELVFSEAPTIAALLKIWNVKYFYVSRSQSDYWGISYSKLFSRKSLLENFDVYFENERMLVLTWRGNGKHRVEASIADEIAGSIGGARSKNSRFYSALQAI